MKLIYTIIITLVMLLVVTFSLQNTAMVPIKYYGFVIPDMPEVPAYLLMFTSFFAGVILVGFFGIAERFRLSRTVKRLNKKNKRKEKELSESKSLQVAEETESSEAESSETEASDQP